MSIILKLKEERELQLLAFGEKAEKRNKLLEELKALDQEINGFDKDTCLAEIEELTYCAIKLGLIEEPQAVSSEEECPLDYSLSTEA